jgi:LuxR family maltose regulon positive regulatory protein
MTPLVVVKLFPPPLRPNLVSRPHLVERLKAGLRGKLTLISAPAGFGKTTLVSELVEGIDRKVAWLSLDEEDGEPTRFLTYLVSALRTTTANIGEGALRLLHSPQPSPPEAILTVLLNEVTALQDHFVLVLDDYHVIDASSIDHALTYLVEHLPPQMHLVIVTREDPHLPLARLRGRGQMTELRAADLRFTASEAAAFLIQVMGLAISEADVARLEDRTEGWIAGLQLAALSLQGRQDMHGFIQTFAGDHRYIVDYLVEEVLRRQPESVRSFLLETSIVDRLSGPLCDAVTGQEEGTAILSALERGNFFIIPLDDKRRWYRYHHLFAEVLYAHLMEEQPDQISTLHRRASAWYAERGEAGNAIRHALAAEDFARAADLIEMELPEMRRSRQDATLLGWLKALPDSLIHYRPVLIVGYAYALLSAGELEAAETRLLEAEHWLDETSDLSRHARVESAEMVVVNPEEFRRLPGAIAIYRAASSQVSGDVSGTVTHARRALDLLPLDDHLVRGAAAALLGLASWASGDLETAHRTYAEGMARVQSSGNLSDAISGTVALADIRLAQGRLREAMRTYERGLQLAIDQGGQVLRGTADLYVGMSELHREQNNLDAAAQDLLQSKDLGERTGLPQNWSRWYVAHARIWEAHGDLDRALDLLHEAERRYVSDFSPNIRPVAALVTRVWLEKGRMGEALGWVREQGLSVSDDLSYRREFDHITLTRVLLALYESERQDRSWLEAMGLLERLLQAAQDGERIGSVLEILVLQALAHQIHGDIPAALEPLSRALSLAEPEGYVRKFVDEGPSMARLLEVAVKHGNTPHSARRLLTAFGSASDSSPVTQALIEPLSKRELQVLRLLRTDLDGPDMAHELVVSLNTVRTHIKNIYSKLGVSNRRAAIRRAEELGLL